MKLDADAALHDRTTLRRVLILLAVAIALFIFQEVLDLSSGFIALSAAAMALLWVRPDVREVLERIDWPVLLFFTGFFVIVGGLEAAGFFEPIVNALAGLGRANPLLLGIAIIWVVAALAALVDNIPVTIAMISLLKGLQAAGVDISALWWALVFGQASVVTPPPSAPPPILSSCPFRNAQRHPSPPGYGPAAVYR